MDMDLSRPYCHRTDAPTLVTNLRRDMKKQMDLLATNMNTLDNVSFALNDGQKMLENRLCKNCKEAVKLKRTALHSKNETSHKKRKVKKLSPECQQMLNEITNIAMQLERFQNEDLDDEEYFTEEECYKQSMPEMERMNTNKQKDTEDEMRDMENKYKKMIQDKDADALSLRKQLEALKIESDDYKKKNDSMSIKLKSYEKSEKASLMSLVLNTNDLKRMNCLLEIKNCKHQGVTMETRHWNMTNCYNRSEGCKKNAALRLRC
ncbi:structural maintenance of chromosomes protein 2-like [Mizuhopecten yessoensis]|uniref:structural maintenance of chromosomes protein 2-like n=1 Tax=Mizuhopecten yessoensis TaxID=6573 RepID=UPI000B45E936|nr:structural maintenance of chromosomes protein 2-like [Mizuhopecten yessoensis]